MKTILSHGLGINSTALSILKESEIDEMVFVDHGGDYPETYAYLNYLIKQGFSITTLKPSVQGFDNLPAYCESKRLFPTRVRRWCTDKFKIRPITKYITQYLPCDLYIGLCKGEEQRANPKTVKRGIVTIYPLIEEGIDREACKQIILDAGLKLPPRSCCWFCFNANKEEILNLKTKYPDLYRRRKQMHINSLRNTAERRYRVLPTFIEEDTDTLNVLRADGRCICLACNKEYRRHNLAENILDNKGEPYLNRLCDGTLVKL